MTFPAPVLRTIYDTAPSIEIMGGSSCTTWMRAFPGANGAVVVVDVGTVVNAGRAVVVGSRSGSVVVDDSAVVGVDRVVVVDDWALVGVGCAAVGAAVVDDDCAVVVT